MYYNVQHPEMAVSQLGLLTYMRLDTQRSLFHLDPLRLRAEPARPTAATTEPAATTTSPTTTRTPGQTGPTEAPAPEYNVLNIDFDALLDDTTDPRLRELDEYFQSVPPTKKNDHTGRYEGYNLIFITAEAFSHLAVREDVTPTLYKMMHEGYLFTNFYTSYWGVSTSDGEYVATTGLVPKSGAWSYSQSSDNSMPFAMGNELNARGYTSLAYHNHSYDYYDRDRSHPNMGYDYKGLGNGLDVTPIWPESDLEMMQVTVPEYISSEPFHAYYMTVSGHLRYNFYGNNMAMKNQALVEDLPFSEPVRAYLAAQIELDHAMEYLLDELERAGIADHTLIAMSADHYPYGLTYEENEELAGHPLDPDFELYRNAFILYSAGMEPERIDEPASSLDILPTLLNLMGLPYDSRLLMGRDLFSDAPPLVFFYDRSFITNKGRYNAKTNVFTPVERGDATEKDWETYRTYISETISEKFRVSAEVLDLDYYAHVLPEGIGGG